MMVEAKQARKVALGRHRGHWSQLKKSVIPSVGEGWDEGDEENMVVGYPPCPYIEHFKRFIEEQYKIPLRGDASGPGEILSSAAEVGLLEGIKIYIEPLLENEELRKAYD